MPSSPRPDLSFPRAPEKKFLMFPSVPQLLIQSPTTVRLLPLLELRDALGESSSFLGESTLTSLRSLAKTALIIAFDFVFQPLKASFAFGVLRPALRSAYDPRALTFLNVST